MALSQEFRERSQDTSALQGAPKMPSGMLRAEDVEAVHLRALAIDVEMDAHNRTVQVLSQSTGMDASTVLGGFRARTGAEAAMQMQMRDDDKKKSDAEDVTFLALLEDLAALEAQIAENERQMEVLRETMEELANGDITVEEAMSREVVMHAIRDWKQRTGRTFNWTNDDAPDVLMTIMEDQHDVIAADTVLRRNELEQVSKQASELGARHKTDPNAANREMLELSSTRANTAHTMAQNVEIDELKAGASLGRVDVKDDALTADRETSSNADTMKGLFGDDALASMKGDLPETFAGAATPVDTQDAVAKPIPALTNEIG